MVGQINFIDNNVKTPLKYGFIAGCCSALLSILMSVNPLISFVVAATLAIFVEITANFCGYCLNKMGLKSKDHKYTFFFANFSSIVIGIIPTSMIACTAAPSYLFAFVLTSSFRKFLGLPSLAIRFAQ